MSNHEYDDRLICRNCGIKAERGNSQGYDICRPRVKATMNKHDELDEIFPDGYRIVTSKAKTELAQLIRSVVPDVRHSITLEDGMKEATQQEIGFNQAIDQINTAINKIMGDV